MNAFPPLTRMRWTPSPTAGRAVTRIFTVLACTLAVVLPLAAETLTLEQAVQQEPVNGPEGIPRPTRGLTMEQVRSRFGEPLQELPWVGDPPISRWLYDRFTVYFEGRFVIGSVVNR